MQASTAEVRQHKAEQAHEPVQAQDERSESEARLLGEDLLVIIPTTIARTWAFWSGSVWALQKEDKLALLLISIIFLAHRCIDRLWSGGQAQPHER